MAQLSRTSQILNRKSAATFSSLGLGANESA